MTIDEKTINEICVKRHMTKLSISKNPTWVDKQHQEGIELKLGKPVTFWIISGQRDYEQPASDSIKQTMLLIENPNLQKEPEEKKEPEKIGEKTEQLPKAQDALLPEFLTSALMSKWAKMSTIDRMLMFQKTPNDKVKQVVVGKNEKGEKEYAPYVEGNYMVKEANAAFLFDWYLTVHNVEKSVSGVCVRGTLYANVDGKYYSRPAVGYQEMNKQVDAQLAEKGATTDAIKKGLSLFGFNSDVYGGERT